MTPRIVKFEIEHLNQIAGRDGESAAVVKDGIDLLKTLPYMAYSGELDGRIIGAAGVVNMGGGEGYAWVFVTPEVERFKIWFHRSTRVYLRAIIRTYKLTRIESRVLKCSKRNREWIEALGFKVRPYMVYALEIE